METAPTILPKLESVEFVFRGRDLPLNFHPAAIRVSADFTPFGASGDPIGRDAELQGVRARLPGRGELKLSGGIIFAPVILVRLEPDRQLYVKHREIDRPGCARARTAARTSPAISSRGAARKSRFGNAAREQRQHKDR
jgi:hypothetical protein